MSRFSSSVQGIKEHQTSIAWVDLYVHCPFLIIYECMGYFTVSGKTIML